MCFCWCSTATAIWNAYLGGSGTNRPFGSGVILDGVDLDVEMNNGAQYYSTFAKTLKGSLAHQYLPDSRGLMAHKASKVTFLLQGYLYIWCLQAIQQPNLGRELHNLHDVLDAWLQFIPKFQMQACLACLHRCGQS